MVFIKGFFLCSKKHKEDDFANTKVDERCLWLAWQY